MRKKEIIKRIESLEKTLQVLDHDFYYLKEKQRKNAISNIINTPDYPMLDYKNRFEDFEARIYALEHPFKFNVGDEVEFKYKEKFISLSALFGAIDDSQKEPEKQTGIIVAREQHLTNTYNTYTIVVPGKSESYKNISENNIDKK